MSLELLSTLASAASHRAFSSSEQTFCGGVDHTSDFKHCCKASANLYATYNSSSSSGDLQSLMTLAVETARGEPRDAITILPVCGRGIALEFHEYQVSYYHPILNCFVVWHLTMCPNFQPRKHGFHLSV